MIPSLSGFPKPLECEGCRSQNEEINPECGECAISLDQDYQLWKRDFEKELRKMLENAQKLKKQDASAAYHYEYVLKQILGEEVKQ